MSAYLAVAAFLAGFGTACAVMAYVEWREGAVKRERHQSRLGGRHG